MRHSEEKLSLLNWKYPALSIKRIIFQPTSYQTL